jgi:hypothetical protein
LRMGAHAISTPLYYNREDMEVQAPPIVSVSPRNSLPAGGSYYIIIYFQHAGKRYDPDELSLSLTITKPSGNVASYQYPDSIIRERVGVYKALVFVDEKGHYEYEVRAGRFAVRGKFVGV